MSLQSMPVLYATNFKKLFGSYLGNEVQALKRLKRCKKLSKAFQIAKGLVKQLDSRWLGWVSAYFSEISSGNHSEQIMKPSALGTIFALLHSVIMIPTWLIRAQMHYCG